MSQPPKCYRLSPGGLSLFVRVTPNGGRDAIEGVETRDDGTAVLRVRVSAVPDKGKANAAVVASLARALGVPKSAVSVVSGETARMKTLDVAGDGAALIEKLTALALPPP
ncbi:DUF167 domain-containing protein [Devosia oryziradicis]|uniref:UPF0235 protein JI749_03145 n=1 Tax=Devosia oryziradicis TaxID=2801335 RepID=A0ABX7C507_9HYPH|nr:DUF167 family protein [Devosia oryziradicis]QQR37720.1 DUF167 domain-containing protein [Devosia oryziradicis]